MRTRAPWALIIGFALIQLAACGDDETPRDPQQSCRDFLDLWCNKNTECVAPSERARAQEDCHFVVELDLDCKKIAGVSEGFTACLDVISASQCVPSKGIAFPTACRGVLLE